MSKTKKIILIVLAVIVIFYFLPAGEFSKVKTEPGVFPMAGLAQTCLGLAFNEVCSRDTGFGFQGVTICKRQCYGLIFQRPSSVNPIVAKVYYLTGLSNPNRF